MRAWILREVPGDYLLSDVPTPEPGPNEVQVRVYASALNHLDLWVARGKPAPPHLPHVGGADGAGVISSMGSEVRNLQVGDEVIIDPSLWCGSCSRCQSGTTVLCESFGVLGEHRWGTFADYVVVPSQNVVSKPDNRTFVEAGSFALTYMTAFRMLERANVKEGEKVLITGIGGGVAGAALVLAKDRGADVTVTSRSKEKLEKAERLGAHNVIWPSHDLPADTFDVVIDSVGGALWPLTLNSLRTGGRFVSCGSTAGAKVELSLPSLFWNQYQIIGSSMGSKSDFDAVYERFCEGMPVVQDDVYTFEDWSLAMQRLEAGEQFGKLAMSHLD